MIEVEMHVGADITLLGLRAKTIERLRKKLSVANAKYLYAERHKRSTAGLVERIETLVEHPDGSIHLPRGAIKEIRAGAEEDGQVLKMTRDDRTWGTPIPAVAVPSLYNYQEEAIRKLEKHLQGLVILPPGCGKTRIGVSAVALLSRTTFIIVPSKDIIDQWREQLLKIGLGSGELSSGSWDVRDITVATYASAKLLVEREPWTAKNFGLLVVDEAHHIPCRTLQETLMHIPARWRLGLTATPDREDGQGEIVGWSFGPRLIERTTREMIHLGYLSPAEIEFISSDFVFEWDGPDRKRRVAMEEALCASAKRNDIIVENAAHDGRDGHTVLVLTGRKEHANHLAERIENRGVSCVPLTSLVSKKKRAAAIGDFKEGRLRVVCATQLADEALDVPRLSRIVLAFPHQAKGATMQRLGRLLRKLEGKQAKLIDIIDPRVHTLVRRAAARRSVYRDAGLIDK